MNAMALDAEDGFEEVELERPKPGLTEVVIKVGGAGINPVDWKTRHGQGVRPFFAPDSPVVLGWDVGGEVVDVGKGVTKFAPGDRVFGMPRFPRPAKAYAQYVVVGAREVARTPDAITDVEAGALPLAVLTAWQALVDTLQVGDGDRVLIHAASGGVGHLAVQIAKARGAEVWGTASAGKHDQLRELGLDHPIDYRTEVFEEVATEMDAVLDLIGSNDYATRSLRSLRRGGQLVLIPSPADMPSADAIADAGVVARWMLVEPDYAALEQIAQMIEDGALRVIVGDSRPLERVGELHDIGQTGGGPVGKLVAVVD